jgi:hypothetical protein
MRRSSSGALRCRGRQRLESFEEQRSVRYDYFNRTATTKSNLLENRPVETQYFFTDNDVTGAPLTGNRSYEPGRAFLARHPGLLGEEGVTGGSWQPPAAQTV